MGRHQLPRTRRKSATVLAALAAPAVVFLAAGADAYPGAAPEVAAPVAADVAPGCFEVVAAMPAPGVPGDGAGRSAEFAAASRWHRQSRFLPVGVASERGLQVRTILVARAISATFPEIHEIGGVRPDPLPWHPNGLAIDVMIPNAGTAQGIALGNRIVAFVRRNARRFGMQDAIWRGVYYTPGGAQPSRLGHYDHVHVTTTGGGYPTGREMYLR
ncbi:hypothetical protein [Mycobacterium helveticum]|uniref:ARB-07466-like C-terminal domain-containing protein n=1 Tax=Mycobacterium helveticum TaxID=2592811 RepID=A0A557XFH0_9MYCO|nr:hypothetical protein [Mycobacterium helveticum]TVS78058.1 hypothetical protein FPZ46_23925 [Mycobacterium helveticum]TVS84377.1 hypothetical protein FPZ47_21835 [Mycobacterium helveticum]